MTQIVDKRIIALRRFALGISLLTVLGHTLLEFEQPHQYVIVALLAGYLMDLLLETISAFLDHRPPRYQGDLINFLLPAHISSLAISIFIFSNDRLWPVVFAVFVAIGSKYVFRVSGIRGSRHFLNPSNTGVVVALFVFPWIGLAIPSQFTGKFTGWADWGFVALIIVLGSFFNGVLTGRLPLIMAWLTAFLLQAICRYLLLGTSLWVTLHPMTGVVFYLFTFYMLPDPGTTPIATKNQIFFGSSVGFVYGVLILLEVRFTILFALAFVCCMRGILMSWQSRLHLMKSASPGI